MARILMVDDYLLCRAPLRLILGDAGHEVVGVAQDEVLEAGDADEALICMHRTALASPWCSAT